MSIVYVIHSAEDLEFIRGTLLASLPSQGFDRWVSSSFATPQVMDKCHAILLVLTRAALDEPRVREETARALECRLPLLAVLAGPIGDDDRARLPERLWSLPLIDFTADVSAAREALAGLLPPVEPANEADELSAVGEPIDWNEAIFSAALADVLKRHDHSRAQALVETLALYLRKHPGFTYPPAPANADLAALRKDRQFKLMQLHAEAVLGSGTRDAKVRRQYAQSLIEQKELDRALEVLASILREPESPEGEKVEARGLIGRAYKQQCIDAPDDPGAHDRLRRAIHAYESVFEEDPSQLWHGINAASCRLRADRDGVQGADPERARGIAGRVLDTIGEWKEKNKLGVWDYATRVEALIALGRYDDAQGAVEEYIHHPDMHAFEVSSTYRQFDEVLQLGQRQPGQPILERLREAVERHRAGGLAGSTVSAASEPRPLLLRVADPDWQPSTDIAGLVLERRLGTIVSAQGTEASVAALLKDPGVISIDQSRPAGVTECVRSIPFVNVADNYLSSVGPYQEQGDGALIAVIDNGIDVLHEAFLDGQGQSRIVGIWDQRDSSGPPPKGFSYGTFHTAADIAGYVESQSVAAAKALGRNKDGHGTHVASIAAGRKVGDFAGGVAPGARLLIVVSSSQGPTGYSISHLDALAFIDTFATELGLPVVVNLSQGMNAGAHDGTSALEAMFDEFSKGGRRPGRVVVKSAGNERFNKNGHAKVILGEDAQDELPWRRDPEGTGVERLELWWSAADELEFQLQDPVGNSTPWVGATTPKLSSTLGGLPFVLQFVKRHIDNGDSQLSVEIGDSFSQVPPGTWKLQIRSHKVPRGGEVHAWIERGPGRPSSFTRHESEEMTLSIPGTAKNVIAVAAVDAAKPIRVGEFSSFGPTRDRREKPEVAAPGVEIWAARGGTRSEIKRDSGTSMAAPHVSGAIALLFSRMAKTNQPIPTSSQISTALSQKTLNFNGRWNPGQGYGVLNVKAFLECF